MAMMVMDRKGRFFNPSRASPLDINVREGYRGRREVFIGKQPAVAVITGYCTESNLIHGKLHKSIGVLFHGQEWERYCCFITMIFDQQQMVAQLYRSAITFSTLPDSISAPPIFPNASLSPLSGRRAKIIDTPVERARGALYFSDVGKSIFRFIDGCHQFMTNNSMLVPVFDARQTKLTAETNFECLEDTFPRFEGEVPVGSCVAVGHSVSSYLGRKADNIHLATNVLFVIVFGTPY